MSGQQSQQQWPAPNQFRMPEAFRNWQQFSARPPQPGELPRTPQPQLLQPVPVPPMPQGLQAPQALPVPQPSRNCRRSTVLFVTSALGSFRRVAMMPSLRVHCVAIASRARISWWAARSSNEASVISTITRRIVPVNANGD